MHTEVHDTAQTRKAQGMKQVINGNKAWRDAALNVIRSLPVGWIGTGEAIREAVNEEPSHPNAWGSLVSAALKADLIYPTGVMVAMVAKKSHGRKTAVYERM